MNSGQMLLVLGALVLLAGVSLGINRLLLDKTTTMLETEASLQAIALGQSMIDEIMANSYDQNTANGAVLFDAVDFTAAGSLGPGGSEASSVPIPEPPDTLTPYK